MRRKVWQGGKEEEDQAARQGDKDQQGKEHHGFPEACSQDCCPTEDKDKHGAWVIDETEEEVCLFPCKQSFVILVRNKCGTGRIAA